MTFTSHIPSTHRTRESDHIQEVAWFTAYRARFELPFGGTDTMGMLRHHTLLPPCSVMWTRARTCSPQRQMQNTLRGSDWCKACPKVHGMHDEPGGDPDGGPLAAAGSKSNVDIWADFERAWVLVTPRCTHLGRPSEGRRWTRLHERVHVSS